MTTAMILVAGAAITMIATVLFAAYDYFFNKPVCTEDIPHTPKPPLPKPQPLKRLPPIAPIVKRAVAIPHSSGAVEVALLLYLGTAERLPAERLLIITKIDSGNADYNKRRADELVDAINSIIKQ